jgi:DNA-binding NarL/FixJ family response regulator
MMITNQRHVGRMEFAVSSRRTIRFIVADDHEAIRRGVRWFAELYGDLQLVGEAVDGDSAIDLCRDLQPDLVLMDITMPDIDGITATRIIREQWPHIKVIACTSLADADKIRQIMASGAAAHIPKYSTLEELVTLIRRVVNEA